MSWTQASLASDLGAIGLHAGDAVLTHSSFKALGPGDGGPEALIRAILEAVGEDGTALFPAHTWVNASQENPPTFDVRLTPSAKVGVVAETARLWPGAIRSVHPTHSVSAIGRHALWFTEGHYDDGICGIGSPYDRLCDPPARAGYILLLGVDQERNTSLHMDEELLDIPGAFRGRAICKVTGYDGVQRNRDTRFHSSKDRKFMVIDEELDRLGIQNRAKIGAADCRLVHAAKLREFVLAQLRINTDYFWASPLPEK